MWPENYGSRNDRPEHPEEELAAFALNALDGPEYQDVARHVLQCFHCQEVLVGFQETAARLVGGAPETLLPPGLKARAMSAATNPGGAVPQRAALPPPDARWSLRRLRRWIAPVAIGTLSLLLAAAVGVIAQQQREIEQITTANQITTEQVIAASTAATTETLVEAFQSEGMATRNAVIAAGTAGTVDDRGSAATAGGSQSATAPAVSVRSIGARAGGGRDGSADFAATASASAGGVSFETEPVELVKQEMADVVEATIFAAQPETEKLPMTSPMGTEPEARGVLMVDPSGQHAVLMVSGMPTDTYRVMLFGIGGEGTLVGRIVVNEDDGNSVQSLETNKSVFDYREVALIPDERNGPTVPSGKKFLTARIIAGPPLPPDPVR